MGENFAGDILHPHLDSWDLRDSKFTGITHLEVPETQYPAQRQLSCLSGLHSQFVLRLAPVLNGLLDGARCCTVE